MSDFWQTVWLLISIFVSVAYLIILFQIVVDLFRDPGLGGFAKALWIIGLIFVPLVTAFLYVIARGRGMTERQLAASRQIKTETDAYIREVAGRSPTDQISGAKALLDAGAISPNEFDRLKAKALA